VRFGKLADCKQFAHSGQYTCVDVLTSLEGNKRFRTWVEKELDGYDQTDELPEYRRVRAIWSSRMGVRYIVRAIRDIDMFPVRRDRDLTETASGGPGMAT
jgi:hypothetical protein